MEYTTAPGSMEGRKGQPASSFIESTLGIQKETFEVLSSLLMNVAGTESPVLEKQEVRCMMDAIQVIEDNTKMICDMVMRLKQFLG